MELYGFMIDGKLVDEIADRILDIHDYAEYDNTPFYSCRQTIKDAIEDVLRHHNILSTDYGHIFTDLTKEDIK